MAAAILLTLALGLGLNSVMFSLLDTIYLRPPRGVAAPDGLHRVWRRALFNDGPQFWPGYSYPDYQAVVRGAADRARATIFRIPSKTKVGREGATMDAQVSYAASSYFPLLGVHATIGRVYSADEDRMDAPVAVAVVSMRYWRSVLGGDSSAIGKRLDVDRRHFTLIGVLSDGFTGTELDATDVWLPFASQASNGPAWWTRDARNGFSVLVRPAPSVGDGEIENRLTAALRVERSQLTPDTTTIVRLGGINLARGPGNASQEQQIATRLAGVTLIVLLIACGNVINLLLARAVQRRREIGVRLALGISRARLIRLMVIESVLLATGAQVVVLAAGYWGATALRRLLLPDVHWAGAPFDWRVIVFGIGIALTAGGVAGLVPALQAASPDLALTLKAASGDVAARRSRLRDALVAAQASLSVVLLVGALLFVKSLSNVQGLDIGFDARRLLIGTVALPGGREWSDTSLVPQLNAAAARAASLPGVERLAQSSMQPMGGFSMMPFFTETDSMGSRDSFMPTVTAVSPGFFAATGIRLVKGSDFPDVPRSTMPRDVIVNDVMARTLWPGADPIGRCIWLMARTGPCYRVIGVAATGRRGKIIEPAAPQYYIPLQTSSARCSFPGERRVRDARE